tara:strand:- start:1270 stop:1860 length:591 start_codon:yes stop_codon:yes gene_type:complete
MKIRIVDDFLPRGDYLQIKEHLIDNPDIPYSFYEGKVYGKDANKNLQDSHMCHAFYHLNRFPHEPVTTQYLGLMLPIIARCRVLAIHRIKANLETYSGSEPYESEYHVDWENEENIKSNMQAAIYYVNTNNGYTDFKDGEEVRKVESVANRMVFFDAELPHRGVSSTDTRYRSVINFNWFTWSNYYNFDQDFDTYY